MVDVDNVSAISPINAADTKGGQGQAPSERDRGPPQKPPRPPRRESISDVAFIMGIPAAEMTPKVQEALTDILNEFDHQRQQLEHLRAHVAYLEEAADSHSFLPVNSRRGLMRELSRHQLIAERAETVNSFVYIRIRAIDAIGDELGHLAAEEALRHAAAILCQGLRASDAIGYLDGNVFGIVLDLADSETAFAKALDLTAAIERQPFSWRGAGLELEAAFGLHAIAAGDNSEEIVDAANRDLLARRKAGDAGTGGG